MAFAALGLASAGVVGAGIETMHSAQNPTHEEVVHTDNASELKEQIDQLSPGVPDAVRDELRRKQTHELIAVSTSEWQRNNKELLGILVSCAGTGALVMGGVKIFENEDR